MQGKSISDSKPTICGRAQAFPGDSARSDGAHGFGLDREPSRRPPSTTLTAALLRVEKTLDHNASEVLDRRNLPLDRWETQSQ